MTEKESNILMDRTFDASCVKRAGETDWANQIITRLKANFPSDIVDKYYQFYLSCQYADYIEYRMKYMLEHRNTLKLRYK